MKKKKGYKIMSFAFTFIPELAKSKFNKNSNAFFVMRKNKWHYKGTAKDVSLECSLHRI